MANLWIDIETMPTQDLDLRIDIRAGLRAPSNYKDPAKIDAWINDAEEGALAKTALDGLYGELIAIAFGWDDQTIMALVRQTDEPERDFIVGACSTIAAAFPELVIEPDSRLPVTFCGWNVGFDERFLWKRMIRHGLRAPWQWTIHARFPNYNDAMELWAGRSNDAKGLGKVAPVILGRGKVGDSAMLWTNWLLGDLDLVGEHARADLEMTRELWDKMLDA